MKKEPTISIITASYNHAAFIGEAIESVQKQDYDSWELLIADDSSTDQTLEVLASYKDDIRIKVFPFKINREYHMRNFAAMHARGDYIAFLNSDDIFLSGKLRKQVEYLEKKPQVAAVFTHVRGIDESSKSLPGCHLEKVFTVKNRSRHEWLRHFFVSGNCLCISSALIRRNSFEEIGTFNPLLIQIADMDLWIKTCFKWNIHVIAEQLTGMRLLNEGKNLSAPGPASLSRLLLEYQQVYKHYFSANGLKQILEIFPELRTFLPQDIPEWRYYLLCRIATFLPGKPQRLIGFVKLHELLNKEKSKILLQQRNPRLLRSLFLSEGTAGIWYDYPGVMWRVYFPEQSGSYCHERSCSCWTTAIKKGVVCFSFPNPRTSGRLCLSVEASPFTPICHQFRLYNQETGDIVFDSGQFLSNGIGVSKNKKIKSTRFDRVSNRWSANPHFYFPVIDFAAISTKWVDIEIEYNPSRAYFFLSLIRKMLGKMCSRVMSCIFP
ncbi:MAG: glycosyltransferase [Planctomycetota bacterium]|jgi:glycosyltransferase involved in cell wall biosynthesis